MENNEKKNYKELLEATKKNLFEMIEKAGPGFYEIMHDDEGNLCDERINDMTIYIVENCPSFSNERCTFVHYFFNVVIRFLEENCSKKDFTFKSIHRIIDLVEVHNYEKCSFELLIERSLKESKNKISDKLEQDMHDILRMCNHKYIASNFKDVMHEQVEHWKDMFFEEMFEDIDYKETYLKLSYLEKMVDDEMLTYELKVEDHYLNDGFFKIVSIDRFNENPNHDYDKFDGKYVKFTCNPTATFTGEMIIYENDLDDEPQKWHTTLVVDRSYNEKGFSLRTLNTRYHFEICNL